MNNDLNGFFEILKITLPGLIVFVTAYFLFRDMLENNRRQQAFEKEIENSKLTTPLRLQAYERLALFLERLSPDSLLMRQIAPDLTADDLRRQLLASIRQEYEHNLSQQIYISPMLWEKIRGVKENLIITINQSADEVGAGASSLQLGQRIMTGYMEQTEGTVSSALVELKREAGKLF